jgi:uncharacterized membrane protein YccC
MPTAWATFWTNVRRFQSDKVNPWLGFRNALGVGLPLAVGAALGSISTGLAMSTGALNVAFRDSDAPYTQRARQLLAGSLVAGITVFAATLCGKYNAIALLLTTLWAFAAGMLVAVSQSAADVGVMSLVMLLVYSAVPLPPERAALAGLGALAGGLIQTALALSFWPLNRYAPERRALGNLYVALSNAAASPPDSAAQSPPATAQSIAAQNALATLDQNHSVESERFRLLLLQAERMRLSLLALSRVRARIVRDQPETADVAILDRYLKTASRVLNSIGSSLIDGIEMSAEPDALAELDAFSEQLRDADAPESSSITSLAAMKNDARFQMDALAGQIRAAIDLEASATPAGVSEYERREAAKPWRFRLLGTVATMRANLSLESAAARHALRLAVCVLLGDALARGFALRRPYWLPMTIAIVLKPDFTATFSRGVLRLAGTFAGLIFATVLVHILPPGSAVEILSITILMFLVRGVGGANYGILATSVTALVVFMIALTGVSAKELIAARAMNTVYGGAIALLAYWIWPTWERTQVSEAMAKTLESYRQYVQVLLKSYDTADAGNPEALDRARVAARLARTNLEASIDRANAEPGASKETVRSHSALLASSHRLTHALMALEAGLSPTRSELPREAFRKFLNDVDLTLYYLASALRGSPVAPDSLPDLREDHHELAHAGVASGTLLNVETDRIANSLNTMREELLARNTLVVRA